MSTDKKRVLIVDDSTDDIHFVMENLKDEYAVLVATNGQQGLELAANEPRPDVILLDVVMPEMDGYETCRKLKENEATQDIDVIFLSAQDTTDEKLAGYDAGAIDYLIKPVQPEVLLQKVKLAISNKHNRESILDQKTMAFNTAMTAMTSAGEQGVVLEFLRHSFAVKSIKELAQMVIESHAKYDLDCTVQLRHDSGVIYAGSLEPIPPLEEELLLRLHDQGRIMEHGKRGIFNFGDISLLVKNMPEDMDKRGRFRDHIAILLEGAENKLASLKMGEKLFQLVVDSSQALEEIEVTQKEYKLAGQAIMDTMLQRLEASFLTWGLTEEQENTLINVVQTGVDESLDHLDKGVAVDKKMSDIIRRLTKFN